MTETHATLNDTIVKDSYSCELVFWLNGEKVEISNPDPT